MNKINVCFATDSFWIPFVQRAIYDIIIRKNIDTQIDFYVLVDKVKECKDFEPFNAIENIRVVVKCLDSTKEFPNARRYYQPWHNTFGYLKLVIPVLDIFKDIDKVLYLDVDVLARKDITDIYNLDLEGKPLGCTREWLAVSKDNYMTIKTLGHIQSGLFLMDLPKLRKIHFTEIMRVNAPYIQTDQFLINECAVQHCKHIDPKYMIPYHWIVYESPLFKDINRWNEFSDTNYKSIEELVDSSYFWHFCGNKERYYKSYDLVKKIFDTSKERTDHFLSTGEVMSWKKEDDLFFYKT